MKGFKETEYNEAQKARLDEAIDQITNIRSRMAEGNQTKKGKKATARTEEMLNDMIIFDDTVKEKVRQITSSLATNVMAMSKFIKERFKI